ncbi:MAG: OsmC family protein [Gemmatimonadetes bacterium]|jgi:putative redox protein|nr:OsmC family protein [Gemmatimonadota bacterium]
MASSNRRAVRLRWTGEGLVFRGGADGGPEVVVDSGSQEGASPMQLLLLSLAGCMAIDVVMILEKSRVPIESLEVEVVGERAETEPKKFVSIQLVYRLSGPGEEHEARLQRAIDLSRDKYCSVLHSLDPAINLDIRVERA